MFTVRVEPNGPHGLRTGLACVSYEVECSADGRLATVRLDDGRTVAVRDGGCAYIMNDKGVTIDVVRTKKETGR